MGFVPLGVYLDLNGTGPVPVDSQRVNRKVRSGRSGHTAARAIGLWELSCRSLEPNQQHAMARRFLDREWTGLDEQSPEPPLRPLVERLAAGRR